MGGITNASYSIDDNNLTFVTWVQQAAIQYQQLFFQSNHLSPTSNHTLKITNIDGKLILDFVNITSVSTKTTATKHLIPLGKIVGGILGGVFSVVVAITVGLIFLKRKKNRRHQKADGFPLARKWPVIFLICDYLDHIPDCLYLQSPRCRTLTRRQKNILPTSVM